MTKLTSVKSQSPLPSTPTLTYTPTRQIACADVILLNKTDLVDDQTLKTVEVSVTSLNPTLRVHKTVQSRLPLSQLFNLRAFSSDRMTLPDTTHDHPTHHTGISTVLIPLPTLSKAQFEKLNMFVEGVLWKGQLPGGETAPEILRTKGYIVAEDGKEYILQGVTDIFELKKLEGDKMEKGGSGKVVFIGKGVDEGLKTTLLDYINS
jgi:G3E family GTPase